MRKISFAALLAVSGFLISGEAGLAADRPYTKTRQAGCYDIERCFADGCRVERICRRQCDFASSCASLYGAYGPWGGAGYWGGYSYGRVNYRQ